MSKMDSMFGTDNCTQAVVCDETDMTFADAGLFLSQITIVQNGHQF